MPFEIQRATFVRDRHGAVPLQLQRRQFIGLTKAAGRHSLAVARVPLLRTRVPQPAGWCADFEFRFADSQQTAYNADCSFFA